MDKQTKENLLKTVKSNYEEIAEEFSQTRKKYLWPEIIKLAEEVKSGSRVLDVGCGNGRLFKAFKNKNIKYLGVDSSEKLVNLAKSEILNSTSPQKAKQAEIQKGDILKLSQLPETNFDYVFCLAVLHHLPGVDLRLAALKQLKSKIKPDGIIILTVWNLWPRKKFRRLIIKFYFLKLLGKNKMDFGDITFFWKNQKGKKISQRYYHAFRKRELKKIVRAAGLKIKKIYKDKYNYYLVSV